MARTQQSQEASYLERLQFDPQLAFGWVAKYVQSIRFVLLLIITIILLGLTAYNTLPKRLNPEVKIPIVTVLTVLPGAAPSDVETLVTTPLEDELQSIQGIDEVRSISQQNVSLITVQFVSSVDREKATDDVRNALESVRLPESAVDPEIRALDFEDVPIWQFALTSTGGTPDLMAAAEVLTEQLEDIGTVDRVVTTGLEEQEVVVQLSLEKLQQYDITTQELSQAIRTARATFPAGNIRSENNIFTLTIDRSLETVDDIRNILISSNDTVLRLGELADVQERARYDQQRTLLSKPGAETRQAVVFSVYKTSAADITGAGADIEAVVDSFVEQRLGSVETTTILNTSDEITKQFTDLLDEFTTTIILVFAVLLLFLGLRQAIISSLTVPLTFLSAFVLMQLTGMTINFLSLFAFLLSLGLLVDDTIVVVSAMTTYFKTKKFTPAQTGILVWKDTIVPIWSTTITTVWAFVPLLLASGIIGEFIKPIPIVVTVTMISSTAIAVLITLPLMIFFLKPVLPPRVKKLLGILLYLVATAVVIGLSLQTPLFWAVILIYAALTVLLARSAAVVREGIAGQLQRVRSYVSTRFSNTHSVWVERLKRGINQGVISVEPLAVSYQRLIKRVLHRKSSRRKVVWAVVIYAIFSFALLPLGFVTNEFFPKTDENQVYLELELPVGSTLTQTTQAAEEILTELQKLNQVEYITIEIGKRGSAQSSNTALSSSTNTAYYTINLIDKEERAQTSSEVATQLRDQFASYGAGTVSVIEVSGGPPAGADVQITLLGDDLSEMERIATEVEQFLSEQPGLTNVAQSVGESTSAIEFIPNAAILAQNNVTVETIAAALRLYASGSMLESIAFDSGSTDKTNVVLKVTDGTATVAGLSAVSVSGTGGATYPLLSLGELTTKPNPSVIAHQDFKRSITISAATTAETSVAVANEQLLAYTDSMELPPGYFWQTGGVNEENARSIQSILLAMLLSAVLILITMVLQFNSFRQAVIVILVIPLAVSSVFLSFALTGTPLSFPALIGVLSLFGIIVTNSMFIVDKINLNAKEGMNFTDSIADAGASRLEPILLTKMSTVFGLLPITIADPLWRGLGGAIISGLLVASVIMLFFIPVVYYEWMKDE